ncbi:MAG: hypothetical protein CL561_01080 [Alphaproteobacteria bacterium]|nr:hypothetical protein [Alphaproteobacteria bacterium]|tara:strand:- start:178 stop:747 length:570 start_codon:yes stop_codon:yes gene_type:complete
MELTLAILLGALFGFALNRAGATNPQSIINMLRLSDTSLMKAILFAIGLSSLVLFSGLALGIIAPAHVSIKTAYIGVFVGGILLGIGFAIAGYCPGTGLAAAATGRKDALIFALGGLAGAFAFTLSYGWLADNTFLFDKIAGGNVGLAATGNDKYDALIPFSGTAIGIVQGIAFIAIAYLIPTHILNKK